MQGLPMRLQRKNEMEQEELLALGHLALHAAPELYVGRGIETQAQPRRIRNLQRERTRRETASQAADLPVDVEGVEPKLKQTTPEPEPAPATMPQPTALVGWAGTVMDDSPSEGEGEREEKEEREEEHPRARRRRSSLAFGALMKRQSVILDVSAYERQHLSNHCSEGTEADGEGVFVMFCAHWHAVLPWPGLQC